MPASSNQPENCSRKDIEKNKNIDHIEQNVTNYQGTVVGKIIAENINFPDTISEKLYKNQPLSRLVRISFSSLSTIIFAFIILGLRSIGALEGLELATVDLLFKARLRFEPENSDERIHIIEITDSDIEWLKQRKELISPDKDEVVSDKTVLQLLQKINSSEPAVIGLTIFRDVPQALKRSSKENNNQDSESIHGDLINYINRNENIVQTCLIDVVFEYSAGARLSEKSSLENIEELSGFIDLPKDGNTDKSRIRRQNLYTWNEKAGCPATRSLNLVLASAYLRGIAGVKRLHADESGLRIEFQGEEKYLKYLPRYISQVGGYSSTQLKFSQFLIRYRATKEISEKSTLQQVLEGKNINLKNKIVLIGYTTSKNINTLDEYIESDFYATPFTNDNDLSTLMPGVHLQAHMISQLLSAVIDDRPLINPWTSWRENIVLISFSIFGGILVIWLLEVREKKINIFLVSFTVTGIVIIFTLFSGYYLFFDGLWLPILPCVLAFILSQCGVIFSQTLLAIYEHLPMSQKDQKQISKQFKSSLAMVENDED